MKRRTILCVFAHPDDECFMCGGTIAICADRGDRVVLVTLTGGEAATQFGPVRRSAAALKKIRRRELLASSRLLGIQRIHLLNFPDGRLDRVAVKRLERSIRVFVDRYQPDFIFSFAPDGVTKHNDHQVVSRAVTTLVQQKKTAAGLCLFGWPNDVRRRLNLPPAGRQRHFRISVTTAVNRKMRAIAAHRSQVKAQRRFAGLTINQQRAMWGIEYLVNYPGGRVQQTRKFLLT
jgi:LmbE family N-acetylglucosaminyl deacetylase